MPNFCLLGIPVIPILPIWFMQKQILSAVYPQLKAELAKGQLISKGNFSVLNSPKQQTCKC